MCFVLFLFVACFGWKFNAIAAATTTTTAAAAASTTTISAAAAAAAEATANALALKFHPKHVTNENKMS